MKRDEIIEEVTSYLNSQFQGGKGSIHQEPYKMDAFKLFAEAYNQGFIEDGSLRADALQEAIKAQWFSQD